MAKGPFILHGASKKIGNMVVYKNPNSNNADTTIAREYVAEVKNPRTEAQATQRMRLAPAQAFYRAFRSILNHSWQGVKYGGRSYAHFMRVALADKNLKIPYQVKGDTAFVPGAFPVSQGSLPSVVIDSTGFLTGVLQTRLNVLRTAAADTATLGALSSSLLSLNPSLQLGDILTFMWVEYINGLYEPRYFRLRLDPTSTMTLEQAGISFTLATDDNTSFLCLEAITGSIVAGAVIVSREPATASDNWLRSNASMVLSTDQFIAYFTEEAKAAAITSYRSNASSVNAYWYLNGGDINQDAPVDPRP